MSKFTVFGAKTIPMVMLGPIVMLGVIALGAVDAHAGVKAQFADPNSPVQVASLEAQNRLVGAEDLSDERAKGFTPGTLSAPDGNSKVAVILWDDAWSELQRRARSATAAAVAGSNTGTSIAGSSGAGSN